MSLPRYAEYRECGVQWLGSIPANWKPTPLKYLADFVNGYVFKPGTWSESGTPIIRIENLNGSNNFNFYDGELDERNHVAKGDLLFGWSGNRGTSFGPVIWKRAGHYFLNQHIFKIAGTRCDVGWLYWCLKAVTTHVEDQATGIIGMVHVTKGDLGAIKVPVPSAEEQTAIATFLDRETGKIDALIAEQEKLLTLLAEKRQATISHAVTRGLNPNAPMKDSGVPWLGEVPAHWDVRRVSRSFKAKKGSNAAELTKEYCATIEGDYPVFSGQTENDGVMGFIDRYEFDAAEDGFILSTTVGAKAMSVTHVKGCFSLSQNCMVILPRVDDAVTRFFFYHFQPLFSYERRMIPDHMQPSFRMEDLYGYKVGVPPVDEQRVIAFFLDRESEKFDDLRHEVEEAVALLKERRGALIAAAITGKIDVRQTA